MHTREFSQLQAWPWLTLGMATLWTKNKHVNCRTMSYIETMWWRVRNVLQRLLNCAQQQCSNVWIVEEDFLADTFSLWLVWCQRANSVSQKRSWSQAPSPVAISPDPWLSLFEGDIAGASLSQEPQSFRRSFLSVPSKQQCNHARIIAAIHSWDSWIAWNSCPKDWSKEAVLLVAEKHPFGKHASPPLEALQW